VSAWPGPVGSGKTALVEALCRGCGAAGLQLAVVTNDIYTQEDAQFLTALVHWSPSGSGGWKPAAAPTPAIPGMTADHRRRSKS